MQETRCPDGVQLLNNQGLAQLHGIGASRFLSASIKVSFPE
jgi:hypothetical protein